jgi:glycine/D-amino acid oxidase-like deaminating enzyme
MKYDFIIIGAGIVGLSTAWQLLQRHADARILLLDKEAEPAHHQTGHNSGVIHAGVYYQPGSLKARFCKEGATATYAFCRDNGLPVERTGKLLVATNKTELDRMHQLLFRCKESELDPQLLDARQLHDLEPSISGLGAFLVEESGIVSFPAVCREMAKQFVQRGGTIRFSLEATGISESLDDVQIKAGTENFTASQLVVCAGLMSDRMAKMQGLDIRFRIIPFRGEYYRLSRAGSGKATERSISASGTVQKRSPFRVSGNSPKTIFATAFTKPGIRCGSGDTSGRCKNTARKSSWRTCFLTRPVCAPRPFSGMVRCCTISCSRKHHAACTYATHPLLPPLPRYQSGDIFAINCGRKPLPEIVRIQTTGIFSEFC